MIKETDKIKKYVNCKINNKCFIKLYDIFLLKKTEYLFNKIKKILDNEFKNLDNKLTFYLLDHNNNIIWSNKSKNLYVQYINFLNKYYVNKLYSNFLYKKKTEQIELSIEKKKTEQIEFFEQVEFFLIDNPSNIDPIGFTSNTPVNFVVIYNDIPWKEQISGYYYWQGNFIGSSPKIQYYFDKVSEPQISYQQPSNLISTNGNFVYYGDNIPQNINTIILFTGYSKVSDILKNLTNYTTGTNMYTNAKNYFVSNNITNYLLSLCFGGGLSNTGGWDTGTSGAVYSIYEACTKNGVQFSYKETGTGNTLTGIGTGTLDYSYNSFTFDLETWGYLGNSGSTGKDFINLFNYIKTNQNSMYYSWEMIIIVTIAHSCSNYNGTGQQVISELLTDSTGSYDFISPQLYTQNVGTTNEYCANYNILWSNTGSDDNFVYYLSQNQNFIKYGLNMILPSLCYNYLLNTGGSNNSNSPNLYFYQSSSNDINPPIATASGWKQINYQIDNGASSFFNNIFNFSNVSLGGSIQWINGDL